MLKFKIKTKIQLRHFILINWAKLRDKGLEMWWDKVLSKANNSGVAVLKKKLLYKKLLQMKCIILSTFNAWTPSKCPNTSLQMHCTKLLWLAKYQDLHCGTVLTKHKRK